MTTATMRPLVLNNVRRKALARQAVERYDAHEAIMLPAISDALDEWFGMVRNRVGLEPVESLAAAAEDARPGSTDGLSPSLRLLLGGNPDPFIADIKSQTANWGAVLDKHVMSAYGKVLDSVMKSGLADRRVAAGLRKWRSQFLHDRRQSLLGIPDTVTDILRTGLATIGQAQGTSVEDAMHAVRGMLSNGYPSWTARARLIARTETVSANNQGAHAQYSAIAQATGQKATKTWLATEDKFTRPDHQDVDGTTVGIDETFSVGGDDMNGPGDPNADAGNICNCRCTLTYDFPDGSSETGADGLSAAAVTDAPDQTPSPASDSDSEATTAQSGVAIMALVSDADAQRLAVPGAPEPDPPGFHITLAYLASPAASYNDQQRAQVMGALADGMSEGDGAQITANIFGSAVLNDDDSEREPALVALVQSDELAALKGDVDDSLAQALVDQSDTFPIWVPHCTLGYNLTADQFPAGLVGTSLALQSVVVAWGDQIQTVGQESDPAGDDAPDALTAAQEAPVTAPTAPAPATDPATPAPGDPGATGGDTPAPGNDLQPQGITWSGPLAILGTPSSDGRMINGEGIVIRPLPLPLSWQKESGPEHDDSVIVGRILACEVRGNQLWGSGDFLDPMVNFDVEQAMAQVDAGLGMVSVDLGVLELGFADPDGNPIDPMLWDGDDMDVVAVYLASELGGATLVSFQAFAEARITLDQTGDPDALETVADPGIIGPIGSVTFAEGSTMAGATPEAPTVSDDGSSITLTDGSSVGVGDKVAYPNPDSSGDTETGTITAIDTDAQTVSTTPDPAEDGTQPPDRTAVDIATLTPVEAAPPATPDGDSGGVAASLLASSEVRPYKAAYLAKRELDGPTPLTVNPETGEVFGHLATWGECHVGKMAEGTCVTAPHSQTDYGYFHLSPVLTDEGPMDVGKITLGTGHAAPRGSFASTVAHYDNTGTGAAVVRAYEDTFGIQVAGQVVHDLPGAKIEELMRSPLSGDWRVMNGNLELTAALAVNVPGFPVRRPNPKVGMARKVGQLSLVAAGVVEAVAEVTLPSGAKIKAADMEALVAAASQVIERGRRPAVNSEAQRQALAQARLRVARSRLAAQRVAV